MPVCHLASFTYTTIAVIFANELEIQMGFISCGAGTLRLQKQILHEHAYHVFVSRTIHDTNAETIPLELN